jgi:hypothetical protein
MINYLKVEICMVCRRRRRLAMVPAITRAGEQGDKRLKRARRKRRDERDGVQERRGGGEAAETESPILLWIDDVMTNRGTKLPYLK